MLACGIDVGSVNTKAVIIDGNMIVQGRGLVHSGVNHVRAAHQALQAALREADVAEYDITHIVATGYGRFTVPLAHSIAAEPVCHAKGAIFRYPATRTIIDIGGQDTTAIRINADGDIIDFVMNDKCGAGTGRFLEAVADLLGMTINQISQENTEKNSSLVLTNVCSVLAEVEIISHLERGGSIEAVRSGIYEALADRTIGLLQRVGIEHEITATGGVSHNQAMIGSIEKKLNCRINHGVDGILIGALGAAILGLKKVQAGR